VWLVLFNSGKPNSRNACWMVYQGLRHFRNRICIPEQHALMSLASACCSVSDPDTHTHTQTVRPRHTRTHTHTHTHTGEGFLRAQYFSSGPTMMNRLWCYNTLSHQHRHTHTDTQRTT